MQESTTPTPRGHRGDPAAAPPGSDAAANIPSDPERLILCPYCGHLETSAERCERCKGLFEPLSRQATQNAMGPWQVRNEKNPFTPGMSLEKIRELVEKGRITRGTILRGPSTRQFWSLACNAPGIAVMLGECHNCHAAVRTDEFLCRACGAALTTSSDRQRLGLAPVRPLPGEEHPPAADGATPRPLSPPAVIGVGEEKHTEHPPAADTIGRARRRRPSPARPVAGGLFGFLAVAGMVGLLLYATLGGRQRPAAVPDAPAPPAHRADAGTVERAALAAAIIEADAALRLGEAPSLREAHARLRAAMERARDAGIRANEMPEAERLLAALRERIDEDRLREVLGETAGRG